MNRPRPATCASAGFSLVEILLVIVLLAVALVPMMMALTPGNELAAEEERTLIFANQARGTLNRVLSVDYSVLAANQGTNADLTILLGSTNEARREAFIHRAVDYLPAVQVLDASGGTGGLLRVLVSIEDFQLEGLRSRM